MTNHNFERVRLPFTPLYKHDPAGGVMEMKSNWDKCVEFHGHECPGLAIGVRASEAAMEKLNLTFSEDEEVVCISETMPVEWMPFRSCWVAA